MICDECNNPVDMTSVSGVHVFVDPWRVIVKPLGVTGDTDTAKRFISSSYNTTEVVVGHELPHGDQFPSIECRPVHDCKGDLT